MIIYWNSAVIRDLCAFFGLSHDNDSVCFFIVSVRCLCSRIYYALFHTDYVRDLTLFYRFVVNVSFRELLSQMTFLPLCELIEHWNRNICHTDGFNIWLLVLMCLTSNGNVFFFRFSKQWKCFLRDLILRRRVNAIFQIRYIVLLRWRQINSWHILLSILSHRKIKSISSVSSLRHTGIKNRIALGVALCTHRIKDCEMSFCRHWLCVGQHSMCFERMKTQWEIKWFDAQKPASSLKHRSGKWCEST